LPLLNEEGANKLRDVIAADGEDGGSSSSLGSAADARGADRQ
jgi:hypothetical protein